MPTVLTALLTLFATSVVASGILDSAIDPITGPLLSDDHSHFACNPKDLQNVPVCCEVGLLDRCQLAKKDLSGALLGTIGLSPYKCELPPPVYRQGRPPTVQECCAILGEGKFYEKSASNCIVVYDPQDECDEKNEECD
ncbi:hypothetical protein LTR56_019595 [Elasticomyces elasticus]|uniref:Hydrophobin n=1 Tax=Elasticomyces elasticus TaxID=574655 RepID=A0AAN7WBB6_9PEZI|nr:hypothetical protein LTR56_019595 [Elasticomyces elasticus]KAK3634471.1 hypothetical protein LTR22_019630 [Elasticomyces elasticus]KAK4917077.1 hypothetical protein LTR49_014980 [Elasticomyces elasticus]KAK5705559.1 hypothetical protein LTR97_002678 [Elasticomyces elasticus]KAK5712102.1 hypothetical protein LTR15_012171 [Elasticomyces elasticus]